MTQLTAAENYFEHNKNDFHIPNLDEKIYKDECVFCFNTPFSAGNLILTNS